MPPPLLGAFVAILAVIRAGRGAAELDAAGHRSIVAALLMVGIAGTACGQDAARVPGTARPPDVRYDPSPMVVVETMLDLGTVAAGDVVYDLGCGDGRLVIAAVQRGAQGVCVDIDAARIAESRDNARRAGVTDRIRFLHQDLFETEVSDATVVMLFLSPEINLKLRPKLLRELRPGTRVVSHWHDMGDWPPQRTVSVRSGGIARPVYLWVVPPGQRTRGSPTSRQ